MASILDVVRGLSQAAANAYDGALDKDGKPISVGLKREEGHPILDSRIMDGFKVRFASNKLIVSYQSEVMLKELHPRTQFENEIERKFGDITSFLKKEYKKITKSPVSLSEVGPADISVQSTSRVRSWVQATKQYTIGGIGEEVKPLGQSSKDDVDAAIKKFTELHSTKKANKTPKNPDTPEA